MPPKPRVRRYRRPRITKPAASYFEDPPTPEEIQSQSPNITCPHCSRSFPHAEMTITIYNNGNSAEGKCPFCHAVLEAS